ncbi:MAG: fatty acid desaturase [Rickettsiaceae bacterium]|nr:fatty acid desaturase [Rickettsiaceae bacterium]
MKKINTLTFFALIIIPILLIALLYIYTTNYNVGWKEITLAVISYYVCNITVGIGFHRYWSHSSYKTNKFVEFVLVILSAGTLQGPVLYWISDHYLHHTYTDKEHDPHSPLKYQNRLLGFLWSHIGWLLVKDSSTHTIIPAVTKKYGKDKLLMWQLKYYLHIAIFMNLILPAIVGYLFIASDLQGVLAGITFVGVGRAFQQQATFFINSLCHFYGSRNYSENTSGDIWWLAPFLLGENYHNYHHAFPSDYRNGAKWYHFDVHKWIIYCMSKLGLAWDLNRTDEVRVKAKVEYIEKQNQNFVRDEWIKLATKTEELKLLLGSKLSNIEKSSILIKQKLKNKFDDIGVKLEKLYQQASIFTTAPESSSDRIIKKSASALAGFESKIKYLIRYYKLSA